MFPHERKMQQLQQQRQLVEQLRREAAINRITVSQVREELEGGRNCLSLALIRMFMFARKQFSHTCPANTGKDGSEGLKWIHQFLTPCYFLWITHTQYFTLINLNLKLCASASFSLLLILFGRHYDHDHSFPAVAGLQGLAEILHGSRKRGLPDKGICEPKTKSI